MNRFLTGAAVAALVFASQASAETLDEVTTRGIVASVGGFDVDVSFAADGRFSMMQGMIVGAWRIDGTRLCLKGDEDAVESCTEYPGGKVSGDSFEVQRAEGPMKVKIK